MIGIIGAMQEEVEAVLKFVEVKEIKEKLSYKFYIGRMSNQEVVVLQGGVGKVNTGIALTNLFESYPIDYIINVGSAGGLQGNQDVGDVVIGENVVYHDVDVCHLNYDYGYMPGNKDLYFHSDEKLLEKAYSILTSLDVTVHTGLIASGDSFVGRKDQVDGILGHFPEALCSEMEAAAVAQVCEVYQKPFIITRSLSDVYVKGDSGVQFDTYLEKASRMSALMAKSLVESMTNE